MKKRILSIALAMTLILAFIPAAAAALPGTYHTGDIAVINAIIDNNGLKWTKAPTDGSGIPDDWSPDGWRGVHWISSSDGLRVWRLILDDESLTGKLDVGGLTELYHLTSYNNKLTAIDVSKNTALNELTVDRSLLTSIDVSNNTALTSLNLSRNQLTSVNVSKNTALTSLILADNKLTALDVSKNIELAGETHYDEDGAYFGTSGGLHVWGNQLRSLDVSKNAKLVVLTAYDNLLTSLDVSNNPALEVLQIFSNYISDKSAITGLDESKTRIWFDSQNTGSPPALFSDLSRVSAEGLTNIAFVAEQELMRGSGGRFMPFDNMTNIQFITVLSRMATPGIQDGSPWYQPHLDWAAGAGIIGGNFDREASLKREDMALWMYRYITVSGISLPSVNGKPNYTDISSLSAEHRTAAEALFDWGIITGATRGTVFGAGNNSERVDIASVIARYVRELEG